MQQELVELVAEMKKYEKLAEKWNCCLVVLTRDYEDGFMHIPAGTRGMVESIVPSTERPFWVSFPGYLVTFPPLDALEILG